MLCMSTVFITVQSYRKKFSEVEGLFYRYNQKEVVLPKHHFRALGLIELNSSVLIDVS
jgi:hypothetical protein